MATPLDQLPVASPLEQYKATRGNQAQRQQFLTDLAQSDPWGSDFVQRYIQLAGDVHAQGTFEQAGIALPGHSPAALGPTTPGPADEPSRVEAAQHSTMQLQDRQMNNMGYSAWRQAREAADGSDNWVAPGGPDAGEQQGEGPMWDRLVQMSESDPSRFEGIPPPNQEGRGELQPSLVAKAAQNLRENPLAAELYGQRLLGASQTADTAAMARLNHEVYAQQARDGVRGIRRRQRPNGKVDWSKRKLTRPGKA